MLNRIILLLIFSLILSCEFNKKVSVEDMNTFISKYDTTSFSQFKGVFIHLRQTTPISDIYVLGKTNQDLAIYFITYNFILGKITKIDKSDFIKRKIPEYYSDSEIKRIIDDFRKYDFALLGVDNDENIFINPFEYNTPPFFLRVKNKTNQDTIRNGFFYKHYKGNWYLNLTR